MRQDYQAQYRSEVESLATSGFQVFMLSGEALRARGSVGSKLSGPAMSVELRKDLADVCCGSLALTDYSAEKLAERIVTANARKSYGVSGKLSQKA